MNLPLSSAGRDEPVIVCFCGRDLGYLIAGFLLEKAPNALFVVNPGEHTGSWYRSPRELRIREIKEEDVVGLSPDLVLVAFYDRILPAAIFGPPGLGCWNVHLGDPERYRGAYPNIWALRNGDASYSVAIHRVDAGIDSGPLLARTSFPLCPEYTGRDLYDRMVAEGFELFKSCFGMLASGAALSKTRPQDGSNAETHFRREISHEVEAPDSLRNSVRALSFPPFPPPFFSIGGRRFVIVEDRSGK